MQNLTFFWFALMLGAIDIPATHGAVPSPAAQARAYRTPDRLPDVAQVLPPSDIHLSGYLGTRVSNSEKNRLLEVDENDLLDAFERRSVPHQDWQGEHVGKFLHAATLAWVYTRDTRLKQKIDRVAARLIRTQEADGYLGTYPAEKRWTSWDVWVHKYDLLGLLMYYRYTGNATALAASRKIGDLLIETFPAKKSIIQAGEHMGMAATSVLEPIVLLYRTTGDPRYLAFAKYIIRAWNEPGGPHIIQTLTTQRNVAKTANGKAYEMLSNLVGLCELARATGNRTYLVPVVNAWQDITTHRLYITGTASSHEHFQADYDLPNQPGANLGETCVTVTWIQMNTQLLRLTGNARYADELERSYYNHLAGSQRPDGAEWCYYTPLEGTKPYTDSTNCCLSSGPRGMALLPQIAYLKRTDSKRDTLLVNLFEPSQATLTLGGQRVTVVQKTPFPRAGVSTLTLHLSRPAIFGVQVRSPRWATPLVLGVADGPPMPGPVGGWAVVPARRWKNGDQVHIHFTLQGSLVMGTHSNSGRAALTWGPFVLADDASRNPTLPSPFTLALAAGSARPAVRLASATSAGLTFVAPVQASPGAAVRQAAFVPFAEAGDGGGRYRVWLRAPGAASPADQSVLMGGIESGSRPGNLNGSIIDGDLSSAVVTYDGRKADQDWFAVTLPAPVTVRRVVFAHGKTFHDGGWFDSSQGKPQVEAQRVKNGPWETLGTLDEYPNTTATNDAGLKDGQAFTLHLGAPREIIGIRVVGRPASGDSPAAAFASCGELQAFAN